MSKIIFSSMAAITVRFFGIVLFYIVSLDAPDKAVIIDKFLVALTLSQSIYLFHMPSVAFRFSHSQRLTRVINNFHWAFLLVSFLGVLCLFWPDASAHLNPFLVAGVVVSPVYINVEKFKRSGADFSYLLIEAVIVNSIVLYFWFIGELPSSRQLACIGTVLLLCFGLPRHFWNMKVRLIDYRLVIGIGLSFLLPSLFFLVVGLGPRLSNLVGQGVGADTLVQWRTYIFPIGVTAILLQLVLRQALNNRMKPAIFSTLTVPVLVCLLLSSGWIIVVNLFFHINTDWIDMILYALILSTVLLHQIQGIPIHYFRLHKLAAKRSLQFIPLLVIALVLSGVDQRLSLGATLSVLMFSAFVRHRYLGKLVMAKEKKSQWLD